MATNHYFNNYNSLPEQRLIENLIVESIKVMGFDTYYLPNDNDAARDLLYGEDPVRKFRDAFPIEMYLQNSTEYGGEKEFFSKFGLEIKNSVSVVLSKRSFSQRVPQNSFQRPREGDLVYIPFLNGTGELYEIKFVNQTKDFFMLGRKFPYFYELEMEKFKYSQEILNTGVADVDAIVAQSGYTIDLNINHVTGNGYFDIQEIVYQSPDNTFANATVEGIVQGFIPTSNTLTVSNIAGEFSDNMLVIGQTSNAQYSLITFNPLLSNAETEVYDNNYISTNAGAITDFSESNPFGSI
jgi:hypothetical protein